MADPFRAFTARARGVHGPLATPADTAVWGVPPGSVYLLGLAEHGASLLSARCDSEGMPGGTLAVAADVQQVAHAAVDSTWAYAPAIAVPGWGDRPPVWSFDAILPAASDIGAVRDLSYGLALHLAACSSASRLALPGTSLFSATVGSDGRLGGVAGVDTKAKFVRDALPGVRELWVAECDVVAARAALAGRAGVAVRTADHLREVIEQVFGEGAVHRALSALSASERDDLVSWLWRDVVCLHRSLPEWTAMFRTVQALVALPGAETDPHLQHLVSVLARHMGEVRPHRLPNSRALAVTPRPLRLGLIAQALQHVSDGGELEDGDPLPKAVDALAAPTERHTEDFQLLGAIARAHAVRGALPDAIAAASAAVEGWCDVLSTPAEATRPLCVWLHVLGVQGDASALTQFVRGRGATVRAAAVRAGQWSGAAFIQLAACVAELRVWEISAPERDARGQPNVGALEGLWRAMGSRDFPMHVGLSSGRHLARFRRAQGQKDAADTIVDRLLQTGGDHPFFSVFGHLAELDAALCEQEPEGVRLRLEHLTRADPLAGRLAGQVSHAGVLACARHVALTYPY